MNTQLTDRGRYSLRFAARPEVGPARLLPTSSILGFNLVNAKLAQTVYWIASRAQACIPTQIAFLNAHCVNIARDDWKYNAALQDMDALLPDGSGVAFAGKVERQPLGDNLNGTDLFGPLLRCLAFRNISVFFLGGRYGVADAAARNAKKATPKLQVAGTHHGYFSPSEEDAVIDTINRSGARVVFVAFGVPEQDVWLARVRHRLNAPVLLGVGGLFDFVSGRIPRAPHWMRKAGIEWVYRLKCEPRRMWRRYIIGNTRFVMNVLSRALKPTRTRFATKLDRFVTRAMDITLSGMGLLVLSPLLLGLALAIKRDSPGDALFRQTRIGENGRPFQMIKFRSMKTDALTQDQLKQLSNDRNDGVTFKLKKDPRITRIGQFIRKYSIDEFPQLWNVLKGDMALVGPRPALPNEVELYSDVDRRRLLGKPGITCLWQISGRANLPFKKQVALDVSYLKERSIWLDLIILFRTPMAVLTARGAY